MVTNLNGLPVQLCVLRASVVISQQYKPPRHRDPMWEQPTALRLAIAKPQSPQDQIASLIAQVESIIADGSLTQNQGDGLIDKLNRVASKPDDGQTGAACNQLGAFINQVNAFINNGSLSQTQGQSLIDGANAIQTSLGCS